MELLITKDNYRKVIPPEFIKKAAGDVVRECDEISKGHFQAYVDEKDQSHDVSLTLNEQGEVTGHSCDCKNKKRFCRHKLALLLFISEGQKKTARKKARKKANPLELLVDEADPEQLKTWVKELLRNNKDLALAFTSHLSGKQKQYLPEEVAKLTLDAVKSVIRNRKKIEVSEAKKIVTLWEQVHKPIVEEYRARVTDKDAFLNFDALIEASEESEFMLHTSSNKLKKYPADQLLGVMEPVNNLATEKAWDLATGYFADRILGTRHNVRTNYLTFLSQLMEVSSPEQNKRLILRLVKEFSKVKPSQLHDGDRFTGLLLELVIDNDLFGVHYELFKPLRFNNGYNITLIRALIENGQFRLAEQYARDQIRFNYQEIYNIPYRELLKEIYHREGDHKKLAGVLSELIPHTFDFDDYQFISAEFEDEEARKKFRNRLLARARQAESHHYDAMRFCFDLLDSEEQYKKMIGYISPYTPYSLLMLYAEKMILADKRALLHHLFLYADDYSRSRHEPKDVDENTLFSGLSDILQRHYTKAELQTAVSSCERTSGRYMKPKLIVFLKERLGL